ncbi:hypothetical protein UlMin_035711 [Ulmus minor]
MGSSNQTVVCVKEVKQENPEEWDESMPLPGDIIEGFAETDRDDELFFVPAKAKSELSSQLGKISQYVDKLVWVKVRRGDSLLKLKARIVQYKSSMLHRKFTIKAGKDDRHIAVLGDLTFEQCSKLQEMSRTVINIGTKEFDKIGVKYDWKTKADKCLPDQRCTVVSSILFIPLLSENSLQATTTRSMAWFTAAVSSGVPLVFVNIQTEQILNSTANFLGKEIGWCKQQHQTATVQLAQGIRLWFLPGLSEVPIELIPKSGEERFGFEIKRTEEGFIYVYSVIKESAADRAGLRSLLEEAYTSGHLVVMSRLEGKSLVPLNACSAGLIHCCDHNEIRDTLTSAVDQLDRVRLHIMAWPSQTRPSTQEVGVATLCPPNGY